MDKHNQPASIETPAEADKSHGLDNWKVLSPVAILYFGVSVFKHLFSNIIYLIPVIAVSYKSILEHPFIWLPGILFALALLTVFAFISFKVYRYRLTDDNIEIRSGIFDKKHLNLPFSRVQNVKIEQPIYYRFSGHACLKLDTAGSAKNEATLIAIKLDFAQQLKSQIQHHALSNKKHDTQTNPAANSNELQTGVANPSAQEIVLNRRSLFDLVIHGITSNRIWIFLGGLAPFYNKIFDSFTDSLSSLGIDLSDLFSLQTHSLLEVALYAFSFTMLFMMLLVSFSILGAIISFYGYSLSRLADKYIRRSGLFTKHEVSMSLSRLQMVVQKQDWLDVLLKRINLYLEQSSSFAKNLDPSASSSKIIVPSIKPHESQALIDDAYPGNSLNELIVNKGFEAVSKRFIFRNIAYVLLPLWLLSLTLTLINLRLMLALIASLLFVILCGLVVLRWKRWGITKDQKFVYLRKGLVGVDYHCFPTYKLQQIQFKQNLLMKRRKLATVKFVLASGSLTIPMISEELAYELMDQGLYQVESSQKSWM